jgi:16S rRNA (guanine966-N2)-methyltransferase
MRIISGSHRGRRIFPPNKLPVRPTTDLAKESLFNILWNYVDFENLRVLDLFSGTGNLSYEFASRGCKEVIAVEIHPKCVDFIKKTALDLNFDNIRVVRGEVLHFLKHAPSPFDIIFADPPYDMKEIPLLPGLVLDGKWLSEEGYLIVEHPREVNFSEIPGFFDLRKYGKVHFSFFRKV